MHMKLFDLPYVTKIDHLNMIDVTFDKVKILK
jgi:hypothetical protein